MKVSRFFKTPKGIVTIVLAILILTAAPGQTGRPLVGLACAAIAAGLVDLVILRLNKGKWQYPDGAVLTAAIVVMVLRAQDPWYVTTATSVIAVLSKYCFRSQANIFNPAALAMAASYYLFHAGQSWWGAQTDVAAPGKLLMAAAGIFVVNRVNKMPLVLTFLTAYFGLFTLTAFAGDPLKVAEIFRTPDVEAALFFAFIILTDPPTSPVRYREQVICGALVAAVSYAFFELTGVVYYLLAGVTVGNVWVAWRRFKIRRRPKAVTQNREMKLLCTLFLSVCACGFAQQDTATYFSVPPADAPELASRGRWAVGVRTVELVNPGQPDILHFDKNTGKAPLYDRPLTVEIWYPATIPAGKKELVVYESAMPGTPRAGVPATFHIPGKALRDAPPVSGSAFPLVVVSHGYPGSRTFMTWLTENLASKGYVVAAIDHTDSVFGQQRAFTSTLLNRSADQIFTIDALTERSRDAADFLHNVMDPSRVAIVGYSMGGYGALATAGAGYSAQGASAKSIPGAYFDRWLADSKEFASSRRQQIKALVAIAPWGNQPPQNNWDVQGLAGIRIPSLFIAGDQDDVSGFEQGNLKAFDGAVNSERYLLVFQNARHNVGGNPPPPEALGNFTTRAFFDEPVWRKDRIAAINQHFITAFLDLYLKGDESRRDYLALPVKSPARNATWKGFQPRWAPGLEWHRYAAGEEASPR